MPNHTQISIFVILVLSSFVCLHYVLFLQILKILKFFVFVQQQHFDFLNQLVNNHKLLASAGKDLVWNSLNTTIFIFSGNLKILFSYNLRKNQEHSKLCYWVLKLDVRSKNHSAFLIKKNILFFNFKKKKIINVFKLLRKNILFIILFYFSKIKMVKTLLYLPT